MRPETELIGVSAERTLDESPPFTGLNSGEVDPLAHLSAPIERMPARLGARQRERLYPRGVVDELD